MNKDDRGLTNKEIFTPIQSLDKWITRNGFAGYDPYDIKAIPWIQKLTAIGQKNVIAEALREIVFELTYTFPKSARKIFNINPSVNPKAMGLLAKAYLDLFLSTGEDDFLSKSKQYLAWLESHPSTTSKGIGWGYPFSWQSTYLIPANTPNGIVTTAVGDAFWSWYQYTGEKAYLTICSEICEFLLTLPVDRIADQQICFSYTPLAINHVHNLNLFVAEFLIKVGIETNKAEWVKIGNQAVNYTIANQLESGAFDYNGPPESAKQFSDNYHTGFVLRMLHSIWKLTDDKKVFASLEKCYNHYLANFFEDGRIPKLLPNRKYRIDIHSCAESINCLSDLAGTFPQGLHIARQVAVWTFSHLQDQSGYFYYGILKSRFTGRPFISKIAYLRWGQAWMLKSLSNLFRIIHQPAG